VKDSNGNDIVISSKPKTIVSLPVWASEILLDIVPVERITGISVWSDDKITSATAAKAKDVPNRVESKNAEGIIALSPDLVILDTFNDYDGALTKTLTAAGITVLCLVSPTDFDQIKEAVTTLAAATGEKDAGAVIVQDIDTTLAAVKAKTDTLSTSDKLTAMYYEDYYDQTGANAGMLAAFGPESPFNAIAEAAGLINICDLTDYSPVDKEVVVGSWKPQVLVVPSFIYDANFTAIDDKGASIIAAIKKDTILAGIPAVVNNRIYALTQTYSGSTSHYMVKAVEELARAAYPDLFK
jgi:iron complex transport system substrate-binding protein